MERSQEWTLLYTYRMIRKARFRIVGIAFTAAVIAYAVTRFLPDIYRAGVTLMVKESKIQPEALPMREAEVKLYESILKNQSVLLELRDEFSLDPNKYKMRRLESMVTAKAQKGTSLVELYVDYEDRKAVPKMAEFLAKKAVDKNTQLESKEIADASKVLRINRNEAEEKMKTSEETFHKLKVSSNLDVLQAEMAVDLKKATELETRIRDVDLKLAILRQNTAGNQFAGSSGAMAALEQRLIDSRSALADFKAENRLGAKQEELNLALKQAVDLETRVREIEREMAIRGASKAKDRLDVARRDLEEQETAANLPSLNQDIDTLLKIKSEQEIELARVVTEIASEHTKLATIERELRERNQFEEVTQSIFRKPELGPLVEGSAKERAMLSVTSQELSPRYQLLEEEQSRAYISLASAQRKLEELTRSIKEVDERLRKLNDDFVAKNTRNKELSLEVEMAQTEYVKIEQTSLEAYESEKTEVEKKLDEARERYRKLYEAFLAKSTEEQALALAVDLTEKEYMQMFVASIPTLETERTIAVAERKRILAEYDKVFEHYVKRSLELERLQTEYSQRRKTFETIVARLDEINLTVATKSKELVIIDNAVVPDRKIRPRRTLIAGTVFLLALAVGALGAICREYFSPVAPVA